MKLPLMVFVMTENGEKMNREILFKGQCKDDKEWIEGYYVQVRDVCTDETIHLIINEPEYYGNGEMAGMYEVEPNTVCQFTGLYDMYGIKIFENDIVRLPQMVEKGRVKWADSQPGFFIELSEQILILDDYRAKQIEVLND